ncbi:MAG TPA: serine/threonine-protein kinase [Pseudonocardia sp.]|jgi:serine/threonine-protein kinase|nr:serine/threonine-protein kinase [Pseudonocardia sp.]
MELREFGHYRVLGLLGRGGMGEVYRVLDTRTDRTVALKLLPAKLSANAEYVARFRRECRGAARLNEAHLVPIHGFGEIDGRLYLEMRLVEGTDLRNWLRRHGPLSPGAAVTVVSQVAQALDGAHAAGLIHRDVTPANVLLATAIDGELDPATVFVYLCDFGIARPRAGAVGADGALLTRAGVVPGSPSYVAPERFSGVEGDPRTDVYSLACVLFEALTGHPPFSGDLPALMGAHLRKPPPRASEARSGVPVGLDVVIASGMAKDPAQRFATAGELAGAARAAVGVPAAPGFRAGRSSVSTAGAGDIASPATVPSPATRPTVLRSPVRAGESPTVRTDDEIVARFGPGTGGPAAAPAGWKPAPTRGRPPRRRASSLVGGLTTGVVVVAAVAYLLNRPPAGQLEVLGATVTPGGAPTQSCDATTDVIGTIRTNGKSGTIVYRWTRSDGESTDALTEPVASGVTSANVHLLWKISGSGNYTATATLHVSEPNPIETNGSFSYSCR